jgi:hypothetical protein
MVRTHPRSGLFCTNFRQIRHRSRRIKAAKCDNIVRQVVSLVNQKDEAHGSNLLNSNARVVTNGATRKVFRVSPSYLPMTGLVAGSSVAVNILMAVKGTSERVVDEEEEEEEEEEVVVVMMVLAVEATVTQER